MAGALSVGPTQGSAEWWSNNDADVMTRACLFDDKYIFNELTIDWVDKYIEYDSMNKSPSIIVMDDIMWNSKTVQLLLRLTSTNTTIYITNTYDWFKPSFEPNDRFNSTCNHQDDELDCYFE